MKQHNQLRHNIEQGVPTQLTMEDEIKQTLASYIQTAEEAALVAHSLLHKWHTDDDPRVIRFTDEPTKLDKYLSFADKWGKPMFGPWNPDHPASDIGIRSANPDFEGVVNPTTVVHADSLAVDTYLHNGAPGEVIDAITAVAKLNEFVVDKLARPYLRAVAESYNLNGDDYTANFISNERRRREQILTRVIMYHSVATPSQRPVGRDGTPLLIKEHVDKSAWTIDLHQTAPGLQYRVAKEWRSANTDVAAFRGAADSYLPDTLPATLHRAVMQDYEPSRELQRAGIGRIAVPMFISPIHDDARVVAANSSETHPTELAISR